MIIKVMKINEYQASTGLDVIIKFMKKKRYQGRPLLDMRIKVMKIMIIKRARDTT